MLFFARGKGNLRLFHVQLVRLQSRQWDNLMRSGTSFRGTAGAAQAYAAAKAAAADKFPKE